MEIFFDELLNEFLLNQHLSQQQGRYKLSIIIQHNDNIIIVT